MSEKSCTKCGEVKKLEEFHKDRRAKDGRKSRCKECSREDALRWRKENLERAKEASRRWRKGNPERAREATKRWKINNPERAKEINRRWRKENPERVKEIGERWRRQNPKRVSYHSIRHHLKKQLNTPNPPEALVEALVYQRLIRREIRNAD